MQLKYFKNLVDFCRIDKPFHATGLSLYRLIFSGSTERDPAAWTDLKIHPMKYVWKHIKLSNELSNNLITLAAMNPVSLKLTISKRSHRRCSLKKKLFLKNSQNSQENTSAGVTPFLQNTFASLLLNFI